MLIPAGRTANMASHAYAVMRVRWKNGKVYKGRRMVMFRNANGSLGLALEGTKLAEVFEANPDRVVGYYEQSVRADDVLADVIEAERLA